MMRHFHCGILLWAILAILLVASDCHAKGKQRKRSSIKKVDRLSSSSSKRRFLKARKSFANQSNGYFNDGKKDKKGKKSDGRGGRGGEPIDSPLDKCNGVVAVANRDDGTVTMLDASTGRVIDTIRIPFNNGTQLPPDLIDVVSVNGMIYVGDRANDRVVVIDGETFEFTDSIPTGAGVWEMSTDARGTQLLVTNDFDNTITQIDLEFGVPIRTFDPPLPGIVNDVLVVPSGDRIIVTFVNTTDGATDGGSIVTYEADGDVIDIRDGIGNDPRAAVSYRFGCIYVPSEAADLLHIFFQFNISDPGSDMAPIILAAPFDPVISRDGRFLYITSPATDQLYTIDIGSNTLIDSTDLAIVGALGPTKIAHSGDKLFVTHPDLDRVSFYDVSLFNPLPQLIGTIEVGDHPYGIAYCAPTEFCPTQVFAMG